MDYRIKEILSYIEKNVSQPLLIPDLAASVNLSVSYFQHLFKKEVHTSVVKYINNLRLTKARTLLETTHFRVQEVRLKAGVKNEAQFVRDFKQKFGETPHNYRKIFRDNGNQR